jgi:hypothetical protein
MSKSVWERFDNVAKAEDVLEAVNQRKPLLEGDYEVKLVSVKMAETRNGDPMVKGVFKDKTTGRDIYYNQNLIVPAYPNLTDQNIADAVIFLSDIVGEEVPFKKMSQFAEEISKIEVGTEHTIRVTYADKDKDMKYPKFSVVKPIDEPEDLGLVEF